MQTINQNNVRLTGLTGASVQTRPRMRRPGTPRRGQVRRPRSASAGQARAGRPRERPPRTATGRPRGSLRGSSGGPAVRRAQSGGGPVGTPTGASSGRPTGPQAPSREALMTAGARIAANKSKEEPGAENTAYPPNFKITKSLKKFVINHYGKVPLSECPREELPLWIFSRMPDYFQPTLSSPGTGINPNMSYSQQQMFSGQPFQQYPTSQPLVMIPYPPKDHSLLIIPNPSLNMLTSQRMAAPSQSAHFTNRPRQTFSQPTLSGRPPENPVRNVQPRISVDSIKLPGGKSLPGPKPTPSDRLSRPRAPTTSNETKPSTQTTPPAAPTAGTRPTPPATPTAGAGPTPPAVPMAGTRPTPPATPTAGAGSTTQTASSAAAAPTTPAARTTSAGPTTQAVPTAGAEQTTPAAPTVSAGPITQVAPTASAGPNIPAASTPQAASTIPAAPTPQAAPTIPAAPTAGTGPTTPGSTNTDDQPTASASPSTEDPPLCSSCKQKIKKPDKKLNEDDCLFEDYESFFIQSEKRLLETLRIQEKFLRDVDTGYMMKLIERYNHEVRPYRALSDLHSTHYRRLRHT